MSRKHFELIAAVLRNAPHPNGDPETIAADRASLAGAFALEFELENPRFDRDRFMAACGIEEARR